MPNQRELILGHPKGAFVLASTELWERFAFFGMMGLLVHFLIASPSSGGFGWQAGVAKTFIGNFAAALWILPVLGSWLADRLIGARRAISSGALLMMFGYFLVASPFVVPQLVEANTGLPVSLVIGQTKVSLGQLFITEEIATALSTQIDSGAMTSAVLLTYRLMSFVFFSGLLCVILGNMLFKPCIVASVGLFYDVNDKRRESGYTILYLCINLGGFLSNVLVGTVGERYGWQYGFACAGAGLFVGAIIFFISRQRYLYPLNKHTRSNVKTEDVKLPVHIAFANCYKPILIIMILTACYLAAYGQLVGLVNEFVFHKIDRTLFTFEIPATWFLSLNPLFIMVFGAVFAALWQRLEEQRRNPAVLKKYFIGMSLICLSFICLTGAAMQGDANQGVKGNMLWIVIAYLLFTLGELLIFPIFMALITRITPKQYRNLGVGLFFFAAGIGSYVSGQIGALTSHYSEFAVFTGIAAGAFLAGAMGVVMTNRFEQYIQHALAS